MSVIEFKPVDLGISIDRTSGWLRRGAEALPCGHFGHLVLIQETQIVRCSRCQEILSAYKALELVVRRWETMTEQLREYREYRQHQNGLDKAVKVQRTVKQLQWIARPEEDEVEARSIWDRYAAASGEPPYAMFRRGRKPVQYCFLSPKHNGWSDSEYAIRYAERHKSVEVITPPTQGGPA